MSYSYTAIFHSEVSVLEPRSNEGGGRLMYEGNKVPIEILNPSSDDTEQSAEAKVLRGDDDFRQVLK
jgi:hypothetical protein